MTKISCFAKAVNKDAQTNPITPPSELAIKRKRQASVACLFRFNPSPRLPRNRPSLEWRSSAWYIAGRGHAQANARRRASGSSSRRIATSVCHPCRRALPGRPATPNPTTGERPIWSRGRGSPP